MRRRLLMLSDRALLDQCQMDRFRASGPGGQKRNKTDSAVRLRHLETGLSAQATESRSQHDNRASALRRLREKIALDLHEPATTNADLLAELAGVIATGMPGPRSARRHAPEFLLALGRICDVLVDNRGSVSAAARSLGVSTGALSRFLCDDRRLLRRINDLRSQHQLRALR